jgi:carbonic anhydrase/acetyltransferase-like protein (isoleucine patch superfamily)
VAGSCERGDTASGSINVGEVSCVQKFSVIHSYCPKFPPLLLLFNFLFIMLLSL